MSIIVNEHWTQIGNFPDGSPARAVAVYNGSRMAGMVVDMLDGSFRADFINGEGDLLQILLPNYYTAVIRVAEESTLRNKKLH